MNTPVLPVLEMRGISKGFPGVQALQNVDFSVLPGEIHALMGENGAGKSTLMKVLFGAIQADSGDIFINSRPVKIHSPHDAAALGISMVHQELNLVPQMTAPQNIFLGRAPSVGPFGAVLRRSQMVREAARLLAQLDANIDLSVPVRRLSIAQRQMIEIAKALSAKIEVLVMDEPTSSLTDKEIHDLFKVLKTLKAQGVAIVYITHRMEEVFEIADRVTVLRDGRHVGTREMKGLTPDDVIRMMVGRDVQDMFPKKYTPRGSEALRLEGVSIPGVLDDVSFTAYQGEILGIAGLVGAGRSEVARAIFGCEPDMTGQIYVEGVPHTLRSPRQAIMRGIGFLTADRKGQGLILSLPIDENVVLARVDGVMNAGIIDYSARQKAAKRFVEELRIRTPDVRRPAKSLSGGNQQKVVLAKWLYTDSKILVFEEPTRGVDVGAKVEIYQLMNELARRGVCIIMISSELPEVMGMSDRVLVMRKGRIVSEFTRRQDHTWPPNTKSEILRYAMGEIATA
jgi:ribose transport system ATP-binding protein